MNRSILFDECEWIRYNHTDYYRLYHEIPLSWVTGDSKKLIEEIKLEVNSSFDYPELEISGINDKIIISLTAEDNEGMREDLLDQFERNLENVILNYSI